MSVNTDYIEITVPPKPVSTKQEFVLIASDKLVNYVLDKVGKSSRDGNSIHDIPILNDYQIAKIIVDPNYQNSSDSYSEVSRGFFVDLVE